METPPSRSPSSRNETRRQGDPSPRGIAGPSNFRERHVESERPGELLCADTFFVGNLKGVGKVSLHAVVDTYGSYAFGFLHVSKRPEAALAAPHNDMLPLYAQIGLVVDALQADLDDWLVHDDTERPHLGDRNQGRRPIETITLFVRQEA